MEKIFVPTDFSKCAENAVRVAGVIARKAEARVYLFHSLDAPIDWVKLSVDKEKKFPETKARINHAQQRLKELASSDLLEGVSVDWEIHYNISLIEAIKGNLCSKSDLIVMGTHGTGTLTRMILGSNTQKVVRLSSCPVLTVNEHTKSFDLKKIVVASSFEDDDGMESSRNLVKSFGVTFGAEIRLLKVEGAIPSKEPYKAGAWEELSKDVNVQKASISIDPFATIDEGIIKYAAEAEADLIFVISHGRRGLARFIMGSVTETIVNFSPIPVMVDHKYPLQLDAEEATAAMVATTAKGMSTTQ